MKTLHRAFASHNTARPMLLAAVLAALGGIGACSGGGGDSGGASVDNTLDVAAPSATPGGAIKVDGQSQQVQASDDGKLKYLLAPVQWVPGTLTSFSSAPVDAAQLVAAAPGAYSGFPTASLTAGTIADLSGNGQYAIGRWTDGADSGGGAYNANQGRVWAVGTPLSVPALTAGQTLTCGLAAATQPTATTGNVAPGTLEAATASFVGAANGTTGTLTLTYSIGQDEHQTFTIANPPTSGFATNAAQQYSLFSTFAGTDASHPWYLLTWALAAPTTSQISGATVLSCALQG